MKIMTEKELRAIDPKELEGVDIDWKNGDDWAFCGRVIFDYDQGLSIIAKEDPDHCLTGFHGPEYKNEHSTYESKAEYHKDLTSAIIMLKDRYYDVNEWKKIVGLEGFYFGSDQVLCPFS